MRSSLPGRLVALTLYVALLSWWFHRDYAHWQVLGLDAYLASKRSFYEHHISRYSSWLFQFILWLFVLLPLWLVFEILAAGITAGLRRLRKEHA